jgi:hypothetical protein
MQLSLNDKRLATFLRLRETAQAVSRKRKNVGEQNTTKGVLAPLRTPGWCFANPEPPSGGEALTVC